MTLILFRAPPAKWSAVILWLPTSATVSATVLKMGRQVVESREFEPGQTMEVVEFVKSHAFINAKWAYCQGDYWVALYK